MSDIGRRRMASQFLTTPGPSRASQVVQSLGAVQAQDYSGAKWALAQRTKGGTNAAIEREIDEGRILRTHVLRPTWHFVLPADIRWMLVLTAPRVEAATASYNRRLELDRKVFRRSNAELTKALEGGKCLTRTELRARLVRARVPVATTQHLGHLMMQAELDGVVCSGPRRGKQFTYALLDERAPVAPSLTREEALLELTRRYFATRGPATPRDFSWWSGLAVADAKRGIALAGRELEVITLSGQNFWAAADAPRPPRAARVVHLLPNYDEYFIGFRDRSAIAERLGHTKLVTGGDALIQHVITIGGQLVGAWKRTVEKNRVVVTLTLLTRLSEAERKAVHAAVERFGAFLGSDVDVHEQSLIIR